MIIRILVDEPDVATAEYASGDGETIIRLDDQALARLGAAYEIAYHAAARAAEPITIAVAVRAPYRRPDPTPEEIAEIDEETERLRLTLGDEAAEQHRAERLAGGGL
jgi:hypothetical protein